MKGLVIRTAACSLILTALGYFLGCGGPKVENGNQSQNQTGNQNQSEIVATATPTPFAGTDEEACQVADLQKRADAVRDRIFLKIRNDNELWEMHRPHSNQNIGRVLDYSVKAKKGSKPGDIDHLEVRFIGQLNRYNEFDDLINELDDFLRQGCVHKYSFYTKSAGPTIDTAGRGFEWTYCQYPKQACDDGRCEETCGP